MVPSGPSAVAPSEGLEPSVVAAAAASVFSPSIFGSESSLHAMRASEPETRNVANAWIVRGAKAVGYNTRPFERPVSMCDVTVDLRGAAH